MASRFLREMFDVALGEMFMFAHARAAGSKAPQLAMTAGLAITCFPPSSLSLSVLFALSSVSFCCSDLTHAGHFSRRLVEDAACPVTKGSCH
jgi:hypothetical protein